MGIGATVRKQPTPCKTMHASDAAWHRAGGVGHSPNPKDEKVKPHAQDVT
jgi:hypothetical protein